MALLSYKWRPATLSWKQYAFHPGLGVTTILIQHSLPIDLTTITPDSPAGKIAPSLAPVHVAARSTDSTKFPILADSFHTHLQTLHRDAFGWSLHCCKNEYTWAEEVLQDAYVKIVDGRASYDGLSSIKTWWFGVIRFTAKEQYRKRHANESMIQRLVQRLLLQPRQQESVDESITHQTDQQSDAELVKLKQAMLKLPRRQSEVLHLVYYQSLTIAEAALVMKVSLGSARQHFQRAKNRLKQILVQSDT